MAPTEDRFAMPERRWDCRRGIPTMQQTTDYGTILDICR